MGQRDETASKSANVTGITDDSAELAVEDLAVLQALGGDVDAIALLRAHVVRTGGESRVEQEEMTRLVARTIRDGGHLLVQAGTGTGKSLAYSFAAALSGKRTVIATATNQLSEQLVNKDLPQVAEVLRDLKRGLTFVSLKGRNQYVCRAKIHELEQLEQQAQRRSPLSDDVETKSVSTLFGEETQPAKSSRAKSEGTAVASMMEWAGKTKTGDRAEAPPVPDKVWRQVSVSSAECVRANCPFFETCFAEEAQKRARRADVVVTNHALLAQADLRGFEAASVATRARIVAPTSSDPNNVVGGADITILDEAHAYPDTLSEALSVTIDVHELRKAVQATQRALPKAIDDVDGSVTRCLDALENLEEQIALMPRNEPLESTPESVHHALTNAVVTMLVVRKLALDAVAESQKAGKTSTAIAGMMHASALDHLVVNLSEVRDREPGTAMWVESTSATDPRGVLRVSPIDIGEIFRGAYHARTLIATSATLTVAGDFGPMQRKMGFEDAFCADVGSPFHYPKQGMLYIPRPPFPAPVGRERTEHGAAVLEELEHLISAAGGRTLALFTTTAAAQRAAEHLRRKFPGLNIHAHGEAPAGALVKSFAEDETSVLCATMGMWQGVSVEGASCSLVVIDKVSFPPPDDVIVQSRKALVESRGGDGFSEVFVSKAAIDLSQAAGRLIRTKQDKGVVAILDPRIHTKGYGKLLVKSLPDFPLYSQRDVVTDALTRLTGGMTRQPRQSNTLGEEGIKRGKKTGTTPRPSRAPSGRSKAKAPGKRRIPSRKKPPGI